jgi:chromate transporter
MDYFIVHNTRNLMIVTLIGWYVAGFYGMLVTALTKFGPSSLVTIVMVFLR